MSRIGKTPIPVPSGVDVTIAGAHITVKGPKGTLERDIPGAGQLSPDELRVIAAKSNAILEGLGPDVTWLHTYVLDDKMYCVYDASGPAIIEEHARCMGVPANTISKIRTIISPETGRK